MVQFAAPVLAEASWQGQQHVNSALRAALWQRALRQARIRVPYFRFNIFLKPGMAHIKQAQCIVMLLLN